MDVRQPIHSDHAKTLDSAGLRRQFLVDTIFVPGELVLTYSQIDRIIVGGALPLREGLGFTADLAKQFAVGAFLERRELGVVNVGGPGSVVVDGETYALGHRDALYVGMGARDVRFESADAASPAKFYLNSAPAHRTCPTRKVTQADALPTTLGNAATANRRTIYKLLVPGVVETCQLTMGMTVLEPGSVWNTFPTHTHERRMEVYFYFALPPDAAVIHLCGRPDETRHIVVRNEQAVISPSWSIHSGVGTQAYTFIWGMVGENQVFDDMDARRDEGAPLMTISFRLDGRVALVTGAAQGLGQAMAIALAEAGADVAGVDVGNLDETRARVEAAGRKFAAIAENLRGTAAARHVVERAASALSRLDILINNAGIIRRADSIDFTEADWDDVIDINLKSVFFLAQAAARQFLAQGGGGKIVNVASLLSFQGGIRVPSYTAAKSGVAGLTRLLANEWAAKGINVNAIAPGYMATANTAPLRADAARSAEILARIPAGRWGLPDDLAGAVVFLCSSASDYVHGAVIAVDGGWLAR